MMAYHDHFNLYLLAVAVGFFVFALLWLIRRFRSRLRADMKSSVITPQTIPTGSSLVPAPDFSKLYDEILSISEPKVPSAKAAPSGTGQASAPTFSEAAPQTLPEQHTQRASGVMVLNDFRKALDGGMDLLDAARKHGLTEDEARVASLCYSPPDA